MAKLSARTVATVRQDEDSIALLAAVLGSSPRRVKEHLSLLAPTRRIRAAYAADWPEHPDRLGALRAAVAWKAQLFDEISAITGLERATVRRRLEETEELAEAEGDPLVNMVFGEQWPSPEDEPERELDLDEELEEAGFVLDSDTDDLGFDETSREAHRWELIDSLGLDPEGSWTDARSLRSLIRALGLDGVADSDEQRVAVAIHFLGLMGIAVRLEGEQQPLGVDEAPKALHVRVQLGALPWRDGAAVKPAIHPPMAPSLPPMPLRPDEAGRLPDSELARLRLLALTAVPVPDRTLDPSWPGAFIEAATQGLAVPLLEQVRLAVLSAELTEGLHDGVPALAVLVAQQSAHDLPGLLHALIDLNPGCRAGSEQLLQQAQRLLDSHRRLPSGG